MEFFLVATGVDETEGALLTGRPEKVRLSGLLSLLVATDLDTPGFRSAEAGEVPLEAAVRPERVTQKT